MVALSCVSCRFLSPPQGVAFIKMNSYSVVPTDIFQDGRLTLQDIGLAAYIKYQHTLLKDHKDSQLFFDRIYLAMSQYGAKESYQRLVETGFINDFIKEGIEI